MKETVLKQKAERDELCVFRKSWSIFVFVRNDLTDSYFMAA